MTLWERLCAVGWDLQTQLSVRSPEGAEKGPAKRSAGGGGEGRPGEGAGPCSVRPPCSPGFVTEVP